MRMFAFFTHHLSYFFHFFSVLFMFSFHHIFFAYTIFKSLYIYLYLFDRLHNNERKRGIVQEFFFFFASKFMKFFNLNFFFLLCIGLKRIKILVEFTNCLNAIRKSETQTLKLRVYFLILTKES
jgi:hypothetical protein